jgi:hypothetical protein
MDSTKVAQFKGIPGCKKCGGTGYKDSKKEGGKKKACTSCMEASGTCPKCNGTGKKLKDGTPCKCKEKLAMKAEKAKSKEGEKKDEKKDEKKKNDKKKDEKKDDKKKDEKKDDKKKDEKKDDKKKEEKK